jgi:putative NADH-flavin reductase
VQTVDVVDTEKLATALASHNVVISAFNPGTDPTGHGVQSIIAAVKLANVPRLLVVGGAGVVSARCFEVLQTQYDKLQHRSKTMTTATRTYKRPSQLDSDPVSRRCVEREAQRR